MKRLAVMIIAMLLPLFAEATPLGFKDWKAVKVEQARYRLKQAQRLVSKNKGKNSRIISQNRLALQLAQDLTVNDYFVLYLSRIDDKKEILKAVKKLSSEDIAVLLIHYQKQLQKFNENAYFKNPFSPESRNIHSPASLQ